MFDAWLPRLHAHSDRPIKIKRRLPGANPNKEVRRRQLTECGQKSDQKICVAGLGGYFWSPFGVGGFWDRWRLEGICGERVFHFFSGFSLEKENIPITFALPNRNPGFAVSKERERGVRVFCPAGSGKATSQKMIETAVRGSVELPKKLRDLPDHGCCARVRVNT